MSVMEIVVVNTVRTVEAMNVIIDAADSESPGQMKPASAASPGMDMLVKATPSIVPRMPVSNGHAHRRELSTCLIRLKSTLMPSAYGSARARGENLHGVAR